MSTAVTCATGFWGHLRTLRKPWVRAAVDNQTTSRSLGAPSEPDALALAIEQPPLVSSALRPPYCPFSGFQAKKIKAGSPWESLRAEPFSWSITDTFASRSNSLWPPYPKGSPSSSLNVIFSNVQDSFYLLIQALGTTEYYGLWNRASWGPTPDRSPRWPAS